MKTFKLGIASTLSTACLAFTTIAGAQQQTKIENNPSDQASSIVPATTVSARYSEARTFVCEGTTSITSKAAKPQEYQIHFRMWIAKPSNLRIDWSVKSEGATLFTNSVVVAGSKGVRRFSDNTPDIQIQTVEQAFLALIPELHGVISVASLFLEKNDNLLYSVRMASSEPAENPELMIITLSTLMGPSPGRHLCIKRDGFEPVFISSPFVNIHPNLISSLWSETAATGGFPSFERLMLISERLEKVRTQFSEAAFDIEIDPKTFSMDN